MIKKLFITLLLISVTNAINLSQGNCQTYLDSNGTATEFCSPPILNDKIQFHPADYGVVALLNYTCHSGEFVNNSLPIYINTTNYVNVTNTSICYNATNTTIINSTTYKVFNVDRQMLYDEKFSDFDSRLILQAPAFPRIDENKELKSGDMMKWEKWGLVVSCANASPIIYESCRMLNKTELSDAVASEVINRSLPYLNGFLTAVATVVTNDSNVASTSSTASNNNTVRDVQYGVLALAIVGGGYWFYSTVYNKPKKEEVRKDVGSGN